MSLHIMVYNHNFMQFEVINYSILSIFIPSGSEFKNKQKSPLLIILRPGFTDRA